MNRRKDKKLLRQVLNEVLRQRVFGGQEIRCLTLWVLALRNANEKAESRGNTIVINFGSIGNII